MTDISNKFGKRIQKLRKLKGLTQAEMAELLNVEIVTISRIENGSRFPKKENIENLAKVLDVNIKDLFDFDYYKSKENLIKNIEKMINISDIEDLEYIYRLLTFYFETKNK